MNIPGYRILHEIGQGNMATVYLAIHELLEREVALKVMSPNLMSDKTFCKRFLKEGKIIAQLSHPNIVNVYDIGVSESIYYMALEHAKAGNLTERLNRIGRDESLEIIKQIANALDYAHNRGFVHRDVKPGNILFRNDHTALLSDFGIAKGINSDSQLTMIGWSVGTPEFMSPEQAMGKTVGPKSDLYSLGILLYQLLAGKRPYVSDDPFTTAFMHINEPIPKLPEHCEMFQPLVSGLLQKNPADRIASAWELIRAIDEIQAHGSSVNSLEKKHPTSGKKNRLFSRSSPAGASRAAVAAHQLERPGSEPTKAISQVAGDSGSRHKHTAEISSIRKITLHHNSSGFKLLLGILFLSTIIGTAYYLFDPLSLFSKMDLASRSVHPGSPTDYIREKNNYLQQVTQAYRGILKIDPENAFARDESKDLASKYEKLALSSWENADKELSLELIEQGLNLYPDHFGLLALKKKVERVRSHSELSITDKQAIERWLGQAEEHLTASSFTLPSGSNAIETYRKVLQLDPNNGIALRRLNDMANILEQAARENLQKGNLEQATLRIEQGLMISPNNARLQSLRAIITRK